MTESPDFYWKFRLDRLTSKKGADLPFNAKNYPDVSGYQALYDAYYVDLTIQGKLNGFDWKAEKKISDTEWLNIYKSITSWTVEAVKANKSDVESLPSNDFDLLKKFYPQLGYKDLEIQFIPEEVGKNFPYSNMKEMLTDAANGKLNIPGYSESSVIEASEAKKTLAILKESTMKKLDAIYQDTLKFAQSPYPDEDSRIHYKALAKKLGDFPQGAQGWAAFRATMEKEVDEMARLASKKADHGHHAHHDEHHEEETPAQEFQSKYGLNLDELQEMANKFKSNPDGYLENSIFENFGKNGLDIWNKSQEFASKFASSTEAEIAHAESEFSDFLKKA